MTKKDEVSTFFGVSKFVGSTKIVGQRLWGGKCEGYKIMGVKFFVGAETKWSGCAIGNFGVHNIYENKFLS